MSTFVTEEPKQAGKNSPANWVPWLITIAVGLLIYVIPPPEGVAQEAWHLLAIFVATIIGIITKPQPMGAVAIIGILLTSFVLPDSNKANLGVALSGFSNGVIWLIVAAFFISRGFIKTRLGERIAYLFMSRLGKKTLSLSYGLIATDLVLSPAIPSNTARGGGIIYPVLSSIARAYGSQPDDGTANRMGSFLVKASFQGLVITSAMFLTAMAANPLAVALASENVGIEISWARWAMAALVPGLLSLVVIPWLLFKLNPPEVKETPEAAQLAVRKLKEMGSMKPSEWIMLGTFLLLIILWIFGAQLGALYSTTAALIGLSILLLSGVLTWEDILNERSAWDTLVWFAALVMMASQLSALGLIPWFGDKIGELVASYGWISAFLILALVYFYSHYFFASNTAHVSAMYAPFLVVMVTAGAPPMLSALVLAFFSNLFSSMTHYGTGPAPVYFGSGYVEMADWWKSGFIISLVNIVIWLGVGGLWWKILGIW
ncbi:MAG: anion permease [Chloroflexi bacterium]|nr:MAG: anion permease [Chloroflexota bacterium]PIE82478.1 MAG: anion permease [Chloroflexota bacterium]